MIHHTFPVLEGTFLYLFSNRDVIPVQSGSGNCSVDIGVGTFEGYTKGTTHPVLLSVLDI